MRNATNHTAEDKIHTVRAERFQSALQSRVIRSAGLQGIGGLRAVLLERGEADFRSERSEQALSGPMVAWIPWSAEMVLRIGAGSIGAHLLLSPQSLSQALRNNPDAAELAYLANRPAFQSLSDNPDLATSVTACFHAILAETISTQRMSDEVINAQLGILLVHLFRGQSAASAVNSRTMSQPLATRLVTLVETHYLEHWTVQQYAAALGISRDRLNDICKRAYGRTPQSLIRTRVLLEARRMLLNSDLQIDQIAGLLGFASAPQFNRFFSLQEGRPPGRFRFHARKTYLADQSVQPTPYDWP